MQDERVALLRRGERRSSLFQNTLLQQQTAAAAAAAAVASGNPHILISDASSLYSVEELPDELQWPVRRPSTQSVGAVIVAVRTPHSHIHLLTYLPLILHSTFLARDVIYTSRAYATMTVSVCL